MLKIKLESNKGYEGEDLETLKKSLAILENTLNSELFKRKVIDFKSDKTEGGTFHFIKYKWRLFGKKRIDLKRYTNQEVYDKIMEGNERGEEHSYIIFNLTLEKGSGGSTVGYTNSDGSIHTYSTDFNNMSNGKFAAHLFHEFTHTIGFKHSKSKKIDSLRDCYSVPYALGNFIEILTTGHSSRKCSY